MPQERPPERWVMTLRTWAPVALGGGATILIDRLADTLFGHTTRYRLSLLGGALDMRITPVGGCRIGLIGGALLLLLVLARWPVGALRARLDAWMMRELPALTFALPSFSLLLKVTLLGLGVRVTDRLFNLWRNGADRLAGGVAAGGAALNTIELLQHSLAIKQLATHLPAFRRTNFNVADVALVVGLVVVLRQRGSTHPGHRARQIAQ